MAACGGGRQQVVLVVELLLVLLLEAKSRNSLIAALWPAVLKATMKSATPSGGGQRAGLAGDRGRRRVGSLQLPAFWMIGISAGEPLIMPMLPAANSFHRSVRFLVAGSGLGDAGLDQAAVRHWKVCDVRRAS